MLCPTHTGHSFSRSVFYKNSLVDVSELEGSEEGGVAVLANRRVVQLSPGDKEIVLDNGAKIRFSKCLIATGQCGIGNGECTQNGRQLSGLLSRRIK